MAKKVIRKKYALGGDIFAALGIDPNKDPIKKTLTNKGVQNLNQAKSFGGLEVTPEFGTSGYFITEEEQAKLDAANKQAALDKIYDPNKHGIFDITKEKNRYTHDAQGIPQGVIVGDSYKMWKNDPSSFVGKKQPVEGVDYTYYSPKQYKQFQSSDTYKQKYPEKFTPKYAFGNTIENPATTLYENQIAIAKAKEAGNNDPWAQGLQVFGNLAQQVGSTMMNSPGAATKTPSGADASTTGFGGGVNKFVAGNQGNIQSGLGLMNAFSSFLAMGGTVPGTPVEVEGQEVGETPDGQLLDFQGPSHENGGIQTTLPEGTEMYSKRIKVDGVSMADRKKKREKKSVTLESLFENNKTDALIKNSLGRTKVTNEIEEQADNKIQQVVKQLLEPTQEQKFDLGGNVGFDINGRFIKPGLEGQDLNPIPFTTPNNLDYLGLNPVVQDNPQGTLTMAQLEAANPTADSNSFNMGNLFGGATFGDAVGLAGNLISTFGPEKNTQANRAGDTPNINAFQDYGKEGLETLDQTKAYVNQIRAQKLKDLALARTSSVNRNRNSARGINTQRALDLATDAQINNAEEQTYNSFAESMMAILGQQAGMENQQDQIVMQGEAGRDLADRQDRDAYYTNMGTDIVNKGYGLQETGKDLNQLKENEVTMNLLNQLSAYGITVDSKGNLSSKNKKK